MTRLLLLRRMETARRQTKAHLDLIERQIAARAERMTISAQAKAKYMAMSEAELTALISTTSYPSGRRVRAPYTTDVSPG